MALVSGTRLRAVCFSAMVGVLAGAAYGQSSFLINNRTSFVPGQNGWEARLSATMFGKDEDLAYGGINAIFGFGNNWGLSLSGSFADKKTHHFTFADVRTGGSDIEAQLVYSFPTIQGLTGAAGISAPSTPGQDEVFFTARGTYKIPFQGGAAYVGAQGAFKEDSSLVAISLGAESDASNGFSVAGEFNGIVTGNNTFDRDGNRKRVHTYSIGVKYQKPGDAMSPSFILAWTNMLGATTAFSMSPGLNNASGIFLGVSLRG